MDPFIAHGGSIRTGDALAEGTGAGSLPSGALLLESVNRLRVAQTLLQNRARARMGLRASDFQTLQFIAASEAVDLPARPKQVAENLGVTGAAVSMIIGRLEGRDLVRRERDPDDGRGKVLFLTPGARQELAASYGDLPEAVQALLDAVPDDVARRIVDLASSVQQVVDQTAT